MVQQQMTGAALRVPCRQLTAQDIQPASRCVQVSLHHTAQAAQRGAGTEAANFFLRQIRMVSATHHASQLRWQACGKEP
jgi:hypothetical protein